MNMPETRDSDFTWKDYQGRVNNELAANLGNYVNRVVQFTHKILRWHGLPNVSQESGVRGQEEEALDKALRERGWRKPRRTLMPSVSAMQRLTS